MKIAKELLQERIANEKTRLWGDERVMLTDKGKLIFSARIKDVENGLYDEELNKEAKKVTFNKTNRYFRIER